MMYSAKQWRHLFRQLIQKGLLVQELEHGTLKLTRKAWAVLKGEETVMGLMKEGDVIFKGQADNQGQYDLALFEMLRKKRKELADQANLPPFTVFHDRTLKEMAVYFPQSRESLAAIYGVGTAKMEKYGHIFLEIIRQYREIRQTPEQPQPSEKISAPALAPRQDNHMRRHILIGKAYHQGKS